jgi:hypothetical protein
MFIKFTRQMWMVLHEEWRIEATFDIAPTTIEEALTHWTVDFILQHCVNPMFVACNTGLIHAPGRPVASFAERVNLYFPLEDEGALGNIWSGFADEPGYIHEFREMMKDVIHKEELPKCLEELLGQCQCLPDSARSKSTNRVWHVHQKRMAILTSPDFYSIRAVGEKGTSTSKRLDKEQRAAPAHRGERERKILMLTAEGFSRETATKAINAQRTARQNRQRDTGRSTKAKNKRVPPQGKKKGEDEPGTDDDRSSNSRESESGNHSSSSSS